MIGVYQIPVILTIMSISFIFVLLSIHKYATYKYNSKPSNLKQRNRLLNL